MRVPINEKRRRSAEWEPNEPRIPRGKKIKTVTHHVKMESDPLIYTYEITMVGENGEVIDPDGFEGSVSRTSRRRNKREEKERLRRERREQARFMRELKDL